MRFNSRQSATLRSQLISYFVVSVVFVTVSASIVTAWQTSEQIKSSTIALAKQLTENLADQAVLALLTGSEANAEEATLNALAFNSVDSVTFVTESGGLLATSAQMGRIQSIVQSLVAPTSVQLAIESESYWFFSAPVYFIDDEFDSDTVEPDQEQLERQFLGFVLVEYNKNELAQIQQSIFVNNILIGGIAGLLSAFLMRFIINRLTKPLTLLSETMKSARDSGMHNQAKVFGALEVKRMAQVYNELMLKLKAQNLELKSYQNTLESEVEVRTQELKIARDTALTANRLKSEFLANMSHELRTPIQSIIGYTDLVREELELECMDDLASDLSKSMRSAASLLELINNILDMSKIESGKMDLYVQEVDMYRLVDETMETILPMAKGNKNTIIVEKDQLADRLFVDGLKIKQIFLNLLSNASKFTKNGEIVFSLRSDGKRFEFSVSDTGVGIPQSQLAYIFEPFTQVDGSQTRKYEGTGLGMAITKSFCELMGGEVNVVSQVGVGSKFEVSIPLDVKEVN
ncbi:hypothetical protein FLL45_03630 [Aliikangiella marina]|uniref:histidine kinase n=1 Tax=Aliikangiella marina TaxID=1712262 RepID=A0A545TIK9_9GAMM|nr:ATP-binding protein [Aliikangiella marina]TQV77055.1 hypothetical protein FLL45_03630 [Aliikangiella marina]